MIYSCYTFIYCYYIFTLLQANFLPIHRIGTITLLEKLPYKIIHTSFVPLDKEVEKILSIMFFLRLKISEFMNPSAFSRKNIGSN
jgi:hypothetical protein